jgi:hypothetical protein
VLLKHGLWGGCSRDESSGCLSFQPSTNVCKRRLPRKTAQKRGTVLWDLGSALRLGPRHVAMFGAFCGRAGFQCIASGVDSMWPVRLQTGR